MALKKHISYRWRLFIPWTFVMWTMIIALAVYQYNRERQFRITNTKEQLSLVTHRVIDAYETDMDLNVFMQFIARYYNGKELFDGMRVTVFNEDSVPIYCIGATLPMMSASSEAVVEMADEDGSEHSRSIWSKVADGMPLPGGEFLVASQRSEDGKTVVFASLPYSMPVIEAMSPGGGMWIIIIIMSLTVTIIAYITTSLLSKSVRLLRDFAQNATYDIGFRVIDEFPHDELGEISRRILELYCGKKKAIKDSVAQHMRAVSAHGDKMKIKRQMANDVSHELKTPVGAIKGYLDTMAEYPDMEKAQRVLFINRSCEQMTRLCALLNDLSTITRLDEGAGSIITESVDFYALIYGISNEISIIFRDSEMAFEFDIPKDCAVVGNNGLLYGAVMNLVRNAEVYSRGTAMGIRCLDYSDGIYLFEFWDNGVGVEEQYLPLLFDRFFRIDKERSRRNGGTGLGLPIVKSTIESFGGSIEIDNQPTGGLVIRFTLRNAPTKAKPAKARPS